MHLDLMAASLLTIASNVRARLWRAKSALSTSADVWVEASLVFSCFFGMLGVLDRVLPYLVS